ncbi:MAG: TetR family transcriptional regulator [Mycobacteriales bacterium]
MSEPAGDTPPPLRVRMSGPQRREQLMDVGRAVFAERGFEAASVEEIAARASVSKPVLYAHFGGKDGLYEQVVEREMIRLLERITGALLGASPRRLLEQAALALIGYIESDTDGFRLLVRDSPVASSGGRFSGLLSEIASRVEHLLASEFASRGYDRSLATLYSQALVGMVALTGQWWLDVRRPSGPEVAAHLVNLAWNGLANLDRRPRPYA